MALGFESTRVVLVFTIFTLLFNLSTSRPVDPRAASDDLAFWRRRNGGVFSVLGIGAFGDGTPHPRLEIRDMEKNKDQWNVFLLGLHRFQSVDQNDELSYFKIAGESIPS
jgi:tyrosinase